MCVNINAFSVSFKWNTLCIYKEIRMDYQLVLKNALLIHF